MTQIPDKLYFKIGEVSRITRVKPYVLRYWETEFSIVAPKKSQGRQRVYSRKDVELILFIKDLLDKERLTLEGAKKRLKDFKKTENKQMTFSFNDKKVRQELKSLRKEVNSLRKIILTGAP